MKKKKVIQKDLNQLMVGSEFDYSHKIGRIFAHAMIALHHGAGLPILYMFFFIQLFMFLIVEKALMLRFYRKLENRAPYIRQYIIHSLVVIMMFHLFRTIDIIGSGDIFTKKYSETSGVKSGTIESYYVPNETTYIERMTAIHGIPYLCIAVIFTVFYVLIWWSHKRCIRKV